MLVRQPEDLKTEEQELLTQLTSICPAAQTAHDLVQAFGRLVRERKAEELAQWLQAAWASGLAEMKNLALSLERDRAAVEAGLSLPWSNGPTEGQVNRLKPIKRTIYGRAKFDLLRARVLHAT